MGTVLNAKGGKLEIGGVEVADIRNVSYSESSALAEYRSSSTNGRTGRTDGHHDGTLTFTHYPDGGTFSHTFTVGSSYTIEGFSATGKSISGTFRVESIEQDVPIEDGGNVGVTVTCQENASAAPTRT